MKTPVNLRRELHTTSRTSTTAQFTTLVRALEIRRPAEERIVTDSYAQTFLSALNRRLAVSLHAVEPLVHLAERRELAGIGTSVLCRHAFIDAQLLAALPDLSQVVVLGAGYDARAYRFARAIGTRPVFEVDLPAMSRHKAEIVAAHPGLFGRARVRRVEIDFRRERLDERLTEAGLRAGTPTFVAWEGVSPYLTQAAVEGTLRTLAQLCGPGSVLAMDFWQPVRGRGPADQVRRAAVRALGVIGEPVTFQADPGTARGLLERCGLETVRVEEADALTAHYATAGRRCEPGLYLVAAAVR